MIVSGGIKCPVRIAITAGFPLQFCHLSMTMIIIIAATVDADATDDADADAFCVCLCFLRRFIVCNVSTRLMVQPKQFITLL